MNCRWLQRRLLFFLLCVSQIASAQYILNGSAQKVSCNCYTLTTTSSDFQSGSVWNSNKINLKQSFDFWFNVFLGCQDAFGADGIVFILQPLSTSVGTSGEGMGFDGVRPSIGIALDTWQNLNLNDPPFDHISLQANGNTNHASDLLPPVAASAASDNIEDCQWHKLRISWDAATQTLTAYFDGVLRLEKKVDLVADIFQNDPNVFWGFTGATGGFRNLQQFCTALNPIASSSAPAGQLCQNAPIQFQSLSESFAPITAYNWNLGDGNFSTGQTPPPHTYTSPGEYTVTLRIRGQDGCEKDSSFLVSVGSVPAAKLTVEDTCAGFIPRFQLEENNTKVAYQWSLDGVSFSSGQQPQLSPLPPGTHQLQVVVTSELSCGPPATSADLFVIKPSPEIRILARDGCVEDVHLFKGVQLDNAVSIQQWNWRFGDGYRDTAFAPSHKYADTGIYTVQLTALATNGCFSTDVVTTVRINKAVVFAGRDTVVLQNQPFLLQGSGNGTFLWSPSVGLSDPTLPNPVSFLQKDQQYIATVTTADGCIASDTVLLKVYKGPAVYVPTAFTPNGDGKNETLRPVYVGIKTVKRFAVFNRWGQPVFVTNAMDRGWNGREATSGTYVWIVEAVDNAGTPVVLKGTVLLIK